MAWIRRSTAGHRKCDVGHAALFILQEDVVGPFIMAQSLPLTTVFSSAVPWPLIQSLRSSRHAASHHVIGENARQLALFSASTGCRRCLRAAPKAALTARP
jgi:hypothetical protein